MFKGKSRQNRSRFPHSEGNAWGGAGCFQLTSPPSGPREAGRSHPLLGRPLPHSASNVALVACADALQGMVWVSRGQRRVLLGFCRRPPPSQLPCLSAPRHSLAPRRHLLTALLSPGLIAGPLPRLCIITSGVTEIRSRSASRRQEPAVGSIWLCAPTGIHGARRLLPAPRAERPTPRSARWPHALPGALLSRGQRLRYAANWLRCERNGPSPPGSPGGEENPSLTCKTSKEPLPAWRWDQALGEMKSFPGRPSRGGRTAGRWDPRPYAG